VTEGEILTAVPLITVRAPGVTTPVPLAKTPVRLAEPPAVIATGVAVKLVIVGAGGFTVTFAVCTAEPPVEFVIVRIYVVVCAGETLTGVPLVTPKFPGVMTPVPLVKTAVKLVVPPAVITAGLATKLVIVGAEPNDPPPKELHPVRTAKGKKRRNGRKE
jgi:hypothetical protein